ncbi:MAG TPA: phosphoribosyltransferase family protein, partial [Burkholderiaceae bacterium]
ARFHAGEGITSAHFARLLASCCDWLVTIDPHLHRHPTLRTIYPIAAEAVTAAPALADWIAANVERPLIVGPDEESEQWVAQVARLLGCPHTVLRKVRHGDAEVDVSIPDVQQWRRCTPILLDDIISTAQTMIAAARNLAALGLPAPVCVGVHALFARGAYDALLAAGVARVVTGNSVAHPSNAIDLLPVLAEPVRGLIAAQSRG